MSDPRAKEGWADGTGATWDDTDYESNWQKQIFEDEQYEDASDNNQEQDSNNE